MRKGILFVLFLLLTTSIFAQQKANFQGKVYQNGFAINKNGASISFYIGSSLNWSYSTLVNIKNGLYTTSIDFPDDLFDSANASREMVVILDGVPIDTVTIFAPLERDPTVRRYIKDSVQWSNIQHKPTVDTSYTNEIQNLSLNGDTLKISGGNSVILPSTSTINGRFKLIDSSTRQVISTLGTGYVTCAGATNQVIWQSFRASETGKLKYLTVPVAASCSGYVIVHIYAGQGNTSQVLGFKNCPVSNVLTNQLLDLSTGLSSSISGSISLIEGNIYTFQITPPVSCFASVGCNSANPYLDGISSISTTTDIPFDLSIDKTSPPNITVISSGYVGIGIDSPTAQLHVGGRIKDKTGFVMPVGTMLPYAGSTAPEGWLLCDGSAVSRITYSDLFKAIGTAWGNGNGSSTFNIPDARGKFPRGVDDSPTQGTSNTDPDRATRTATNSGGNTGNKVGTLQSDALKVHNHGFTSSLAVYQFPSGSLKVTGGTDYAFKNILTNNTGDSETRPVNIYVNYIIKY